MSDLYDRIDSLCKAEGINVTTMCKELKIARSSLSELKAGRTKSLSSQYMQLIADRFSVSTGYLLTGEEQKEKPPAEAEGDIDAMVESILSDLTGAEGDTLMLDGKPAHAKALEYLRESIRANIEHAKRLNEQENG